jgi:4-carboxymuconolactone decarboxylase
VGHFLNVVPGPFSSVSYILPGTVIHIPANVKHWHGAASDGWFAHLAFEVPGEDTSNEWLEPVTDEEYDKLK